MGFLKLTENNVQFLLQILLQYYTYLDIFRALKEVWNDRFKTKKMNILAYCPYRVMPQLPECDGEGDNNKSDDDRDEPCL